MIGRIKAGGGLKIVGTEEAKVAGENISKGEFVKYMAYSLTKDLGFDYNTNYCDIGGINTTKFLGIFQNGSRVDGLVGTFGTSSISTGTAITMTNNYSRLNQILMLTSSKAIIRTSTSESDYGTNLALVTISGTSITKVESGSYSNIQKGNCVKIDENTFVIIGIYNGNLASQVISVNNNTFSAGTPTILVSSIYSYDEPCATMINDKINVIYNTNDDKAHGLMLIYSNGSITIGEDTIIVNDDLMKFPSNCNVDDNNIYISYKINNGSYLGAISYNINTKNVGTRIYLNAGSDGYSKSFNAGINKAISFSDKVGTTQKRVARICRIENNLITIVNTLLMTDNSIYSGYPIATSKYNDTYMSLYGANSNYGSKLDYIDKVYKITSNSDTIYGIATSSASTNAEIQVVKPNV